MIRYREVNIKTPEIFRIFISGCSSAGKTFFANRLFENEIIRPSRIYYFHPDFHEKNPVDWRAIFQAGLPSLEDILEMPPYSCIVLDDLFHECKDSKIIDYLFRVLSSKRKIHVIIMTQRYFSNGNYSLNIRNSCNYHVLMRNADERVNIRASRALSLENEFRLAQKFTSDELYPYCVIDKSVQSRVLGFQLYIDIFSKNIKLVMKTGLYYLISQSDFNQKFTKIDNQLAEYEPAESSTKNSGNTNKAKNTIDEVKTDYSPVDYFKQRNLIRRRVEQIIRRHKKRALF